MEMPNDPTQLLTMINTGSVVTLLIVILWGGMRRWWVFGFVYDEALKLKDQQIETLVKERDRWQRLALEQLGISHPEHSRFELPADPKE